MSKKPDIVIILADDLGFSDIGCYGGEAQTPSLDRIARNGIRMTQFYNTARCSPSRASLLTGLHPHQVGVGWLARDEGIGGYSGDLSESCVTLAEVLKEAGYGTYISGKWHLSKNSLEETDSWPNHRGFDRSCIFRMSGTGYYDSGLARDGNIADQEMEENPSFYATDAVNENALNYIEQHVQQDGDTPFFLYVSHIAPHWPLHALDEDIAKYRGRFDKGWDQLRAERLERLIQEGIVSPNSQLSVRDPKTPNWENIGNREHKAWEASRMEVYAAQIDRIDQGVGQILNLMEQHDRLNNAIILFLSDNGGSEEGGGPIHVDSMTDSTSKYKKYISGTTRYGEPIIAGNIVGVRPGPASTIQTYGRAWANVANTPFREYKCWVHEGGISTPLIIHWPQGLPSDGRLNTTPAQLTDVMPTLLEAAGAAYPTYRKGIPVPPCEGKSLLPVLRGDHGMQDRLLYWEHEGNCAVRRGRWKLVRKHDQQWELFDIDSDRAEFNDQSYKHPNLVAELACAYDEWSNRCGVIPRETVLEAYREYFRKLGSKHVPRQRPN